MKIVFNTLKLSEDRRTLNIDVKLVNEPGEDYELKSIHIDDNLTYEGNWNGEPSTRPLYSELIEGTSYKASLTKAELLRERTTQKSLRVKTAGGNSLDSLYYGDPDPSYVGYPEVTYPMDVSECKKFGAELARLRSTDCITPNRCCNAQYSNTYDNSFLLVYVEYISKTSGASAMQWRAEFTDEYTAYPGNEGEVVLSKSYIELSAGEIVTVDINHAVATDLESGEVYWQAEFTDDYTSEPQNVGEIVLDPQVVTVSAGGSATVSINIGKDGKAYDGTVSGYVIGLTLDWSSYYHSSIGYMKGLCQGACKPPLDFINHILMGKAIKYSILCGDYSEAIELWNCLFIRGVPTNTGGCGCRT